MSQQKQLMLAELIKRLAAEPNVFRNGAVKFRNLLNDFHPEWRTERFWVCCAFERPSFVSALAQGEVQFPDISRLEFFLQHDLRLSQGTAKWISEIWAIALGLKKPEPRTSFRCPHCSLAGTCDDGWRDRIATCPSCNALIRFNSSLSIRLEKQGWPKKRLKKRAWMLTAPKFTRYDSSLRSAIAETIANEELSNSEIARHIGLDLIAGALQTELLTLLKGMLNRTVAAEENIVKAILRSALRDEYVCFELDEECPLSQSFGGAENDISTEKWVAVIGAFSKTSFRGLAFSDRSLHYAKDDERWAVPYVDLHQLPITLGESITQLRLGDYRVIDVKGLGVPRRALQPALSLIGRCIFEVSDTVRR